MNPEDKYMVRYALEGWRNSRSDFRKAGDFSIFEIASGFVVYIPFRQSAHDKEELSNYRAASEVSFEIIGPAENPVRTAATVSVLVYLIYEDLIAGSGNGTYEMALCNGALILTTPSDTIPLFSIGEDDEDIKTRLKNPQKYLHLQKGIPRLPEDQITEVSRFIRENREKLETIPRLLEKLNK